MRPRGPGPGQERGPYQCGIHGKLGIYRARVLEEGGAEDASTPAYPLTIAAPTQDDSGIYGDTQCWVPHGQPTWLVFQMTRMSTVLDRECICPLLLVLAMPSEGPTHSRPSLLRCVITRGKKRFKLSSPIAPGLCCASQSTMGYLKD